jgi:transcriptional regulator with XRE-family HTH domain
MALTERFAVALKHYREALGLSQDELAIKAGLDRTYVSQLERALKSPTLTSIEKIAQCLGIEAHMLMRDRKGMNTLRVPEDYIMRQVEHVDFIRGTACIDVSALTLTAAINVAHELIDDMYAVDLDIARTLGMRNLSAFIGELVAAGIVKTANPLFRANPHQDGYPDLLLMDTVGQREWERLEGRQNEKTPFSPFPGGGIEVKATCGSVPTPAVFARKGLRKPEIGDTRIGDLVGYDWKAHHRATNNLLGILWDFIDGRPRIAAMFFSSELKEDDWGTIIQPREGGGRTTSVSIMTRGGVRKMYEGWLCVLAGGRYANFLNQRNDGTLIPTGSLSANKDAANSDGSTRPE